MLHEKTKCFVDSNIWLYAFLQQQDINKTLLSKKLLKDNNLNIVVSTQVINEVCFNLRKKAGLTEPALRDLIDSFYRNYSVTSLDYLTLSLASELRENYNLSFWDSLVITNALQAKTEIVYSEDMQHNLIINKTLKIVNPFL